LADAGYSANEWTRRTSDAELIDRYIALTRKLGHFPIMGELKREGMRDKTFPSEKSFRRFGGKQKLIQAVAVHCKDKHDLQDVLAFCETHQKSPAKTPADDGKKPAVGYVYLVKSGRHYKIGRTNSVARRGTELAVTIPIPPKSIHVIETDDPSGVEAYWHRRFADKRGEGEWFELTPDDVKAFKRWKRII
jgi:hypothetical protein